MFREKKGSTLLPSLPEVFRSIKLPSSGGRWRRMMVFMGPGLLVAVGYMDPGNWATDIAAGSKFGYSLLFVVLLSNLFAIVLQYLSIKLGIVAERDLAQACRDSFSKPMNIFLWIITEIAIAATDLAEVLGSAIALQLLFNIPLMWGIGITVLDVMVILALQAKGFRYIEAIIGALIFTIIVCFGFEIIRSQPEVAAMLKGYIPHKQALLNPEMLYLAIGILGATVMPHNLYLHSSIIQTRDYPRTHEGKKMAIKYATWDSTTSLMLAFVINSAILITAASTFYQAGLHEVKEIQDAYKLLTPLLGTTLASIFFGVALLASGQNSTITGTLAGQIVMEGFVNIRLKPWMRRLVTRLIAIIPAVLVIFYFGERSAGKLLIFSQVILSLQLSFAVIPLVMFTSSKSKMGKFVNSNFTKIISILIAIIILSLNIYLIFSEFGWV